MQHLRNESGWLAAHPCLRLQGGHDHDAFLMIGFEHRPTAIRSKTVVQDRAVDPDAPKVTTRHRTPLVDRTTHALLQIPAWLPCGFRQDGDVRRDATGMTRTARPIEHGQFHRLRVRRANGGRGAACAGQRAGRLKRLDRRAPAIPHAHKQVARRVEDDGE